MGNGGTGVTGGAGFITPIGASYGKSERDVNSDSVSDSDLSGMSDNDFSSSVDSDSLLSSLFSIVSTSI